ncbi:MAG: SET domain-containing protein-lysine N-methyltransferase [Oscillospiraceae bacterium]|nr:SET domain-containing protein-lysine N-methyltransferase [Oscillospiraceae bacterium]
MYCLRCGREIPDGELFCQSCAKKPIEREQPQESDVPVRQPVPVPLVETGETVPAPVRRRNRLVIPLIVVCVLTVLLGVFVGYSYHEMSLQTVSYRVKEANLARRENELSTLQADYDTANAQLETAQETIAEKEQTISDLQNQLVEQQSAASQSQYDATSAQQALEQLTKENTELTTKNEDLQKQLTESQDSLKTVQASLDAMTTKYNSAKAKADFMDTYVVFVNNDGTKLYHSYDCEDFTKSNFWAYSRKLAENYGYTACPKCGG